jgi:hypothetical protein
MRNREVLFEITVLGEVARVAAIDVATGREVVVAGPAGAARTALEALALRKLERALAAADDAQSPPPPQKGTLA